MGLYPSLSALFSLFLRHFLSVRGGSVRADWSRAHLEAVVVEHDRRAKPGHHEDIVNQDHECGEDAEVL